MEEKFARVLARMQNLDQDTSGELKGGFLSLTNADVNTIKGIAVFSDNTDCLNAEICTGTNGGTVCSNTTCIPVPTS